MLSSTFPSTIGVEEEYQIIDPETRQLRPLVDQIVQEASPSLAEHLHREFRSSLVEIATPICYSLEDVRREVSRLRRETMQAAMRCEARILSTGTHPFSSWQEQLISRGERYDSLASVYQQIAREQLICGCHVHVGVRNADEAIQIINQMRVWLVPLLALAANSPFWSGDDTGYESFRTIIWSRWPTSGMPPPLASWDEYQELVQSLIRIGCLEDSSKLYWDVRYSQRFSTVELRLCDACLTVDETVMIAGLARALVLTCSALVLQQHPIPPVHAELLRFAHWHAARYGLSDTLIDVHAQSPLPARRVIAQFLEFVRPALEETGDWDHISTLVEKTLQQGNGATRQRAIYVQTGRPEDVVDFILAQTQKDLDL